MKRRNAHHNKNINILNAEFKRTAKINNLEVSSQVSVYHCILSLCFYVLIYIFNFNFSI